METMLIKVDGNANNNKFYHAKLQNETVTCHWGRVGSKGQQQTYNGGETKYVNIINSKKRKGYTETKTITTNNSKALEKTQLKKAANKGLANSTNSELTKLINKLVQHNAHSIFEQSEGQITIENGIAQTPLGILTLEGIQEATKILNKVNKTTKTNRTALAEQYATIVPQKVSSKKGWHQTFFNNPETIEQQQNFLQQMKISLDWYEKQTEAQTKIKNKNIIYEDLFAYKIDVLENQKIFNQINKDFKKTLNYNHASRNYKLSKVYTIESHNPELFETKAKEIGNVKTMWHGTGIHNVLSILSSGLTIPGTKGVTVQHGSMFGKGIYGSNQSSKSLNYSSGWWAGKKAASECFMFQTDFAMGTEFRPRHTPTHTELTKLHSKQPMFGHVRHSINVKPGKLVRNHEAIIWNPNQARLNYLCEFSKINF